MNAEQSASHGGPDGEDQADGDNHDSVRSPSTFRENQQRVERGMALMGGVYGDVYNLVGGDWLDEGVTEKFTTPRLREGPYPADDVRKRLRGFIEPPSYTRCRKVLDSRILLLKAENGAGSSTTAFALLAERYGAGGVTGLESLDNLAAWRPKESRGYLLQGLSQTAADSLGEVALTSLTELLHQSGAHLIVTVAPTVRPAVGSAPWQVTHQPPEAAEVAAKRLRTMAGSRELTSAQLSGALRHLAAREFTDYLREHCLPGDGVDVAEGLREAVISATPADAVLEGLQTGSASDAGAALAKSRHQADELSLMAGIALLSGQDRTVIEQFAAVLRPMIDERAGPVPTAATPPERPDLLGRAFEDRLTAVGARLMPVESRSTQRYRYSVQPVAFTRRHRSDALLRHLWLEYEGVSALLWKALEALPGRAGIDLTAGQAIGRALTHATGPGTLRQLLPFAGSELRWRRRLVAFALDELAQHTALATAVREQLRTWSRARSVFVRCTVAETCAGGYGLARPEAALKLLDAVLDKPAADAERSLRAAVCFALGVLLTEETNHAMVFGKVLEWLASERGTPAHTVARDVVESMSLSTFPQPGRSGDRRVSIADMLVRHPEQALDLVILALDDPATHEAVAKGLLLIEDDPAPRNRTALASLLGVLSARARGHRGVIRFMLRRHRGRAVVSAEGFTS